MAAADESNSQYSYESGILKLPFDPVIESFETADVRFPTSLSKTGSDAMNAAGDYSSAYCILTATCPSKTMQGHGMTFTIGRGTDLVVAAIPYFASLLVGRPLSALAANPAATWRLLVSDSQIRWVGPEKGVTHLALGAVVNALWDLWARTLGLPVWRLVAEMTPREIVRCVDFRYITDAITPAEAEALLQQTAQGTASRHQRTRDAEANRAVRAYTTSAGWLGYPLPEMQAKLRAAKAEGYTHFKLKVGGAPEADAQRCAAAREILTDEADVLMLDANQVWDVPEAIARTRALAPFRPWFIEEPTSPDDILGHASIREALQPVGIGVATGEHCQNRVLFKQLLQARALDVLQVDACRLGGLNEVLAVLLLAARFGVRVVPHSGGVGLPEYTQHVSTIDYVVVSGRECLLEFVDSLHEHFVHPSCVRDGFYVTPTEPGYSVEMRRESMRLYAFPGEEGGWWRDEEARAILDAGRV